MFESCRAHASTKAGQGRVRPVVSPNRVWDDLRVAVTVLLVDDHAGFRASARSLLELQAVFRPAWGAGRWREVVLWQKVTQLKAITPLVTTEVPPEYRAPGTWMHDALEVRDDWESKLLRTTAWSPLF